VVEEHGFSRIPVFRGERSNIVGVVFAKDLLGGDPPPVRRIERFSEEARAIEVLNRMQRVGGHIAVVVDAEGRTEGIVTLEDILEELVGEIRSED
jgi:CBS domain containing-hemolysin-like protein